MENLYRRMENSGTVTLKPIHLQQSVRDILFSLTLIGLDPSHCLHYMWKIKIWIHILHCI